MTIDVAAELADRTYEGPFDLLLQLILAEEVDIHEVSLARIVDAYLVEIERLQQLDLDVATEFLLIAATLVELKARRLLPGRTDVDLDDELALWEERDLLLARLLECKTFKDVSRVFGALADDADRSVPRRVGADERFAGLAPDLLAGLTPLRLRDAAIAGPHAEAGAAHRPVPRRPDPGQRRRRRRRAGRRAAARAGASRSPGSPPRWSSGSTSSSASSPCSSCSSRASSSSTRPTASATSASSGAAAPTPTRRRSPSTPTKDDAATDDRSRRAPMLDDRDHLRAIEAVILVAQDPVPPELLAQLLERSVTDIERWCHELAAGYEAEGRGFELVRVAGGYRYQTHPDLTPVRRALPAQRPAGPPVRRGAGDAGHRRLQAADLAGPDRLDPRRRPRRRAAHAAGPRLHRRRRPRPGPGQAVLYGTTPAFLEKLGLDSVDDLPPIAEFIPGADVVEALEAGLRVRDAGSA